MLASGDGHSEGHSDLLVTSLERREKKEESREKKQETNHTKKIFSPPTADEVRLYCESRQNGIDAESFVDFYASKGWMVGKNKMRDWQACVRNWERSRTQEAPRESPPPVEPSNKEWNGDWGILLAKRD